MPVKKKNSRARTAALKKSGGFVSEALEYLSAQEAKIVADPKKQFAFFILGFIFFYLLFNAIVGVVPEEFFKGITGKTTAALLSAQGIGVSATGFVQCTESNWLGLEKQGACYSFDAQGKTILISWLCTGVLEIIVLVSAILASFGVEWRKKFYGAVVAIIAGFIFNTLRVWATVNIILTQNIGVAELAHDLLFRLVLFFYITIFYVAWFYFSQRG